MADHETFSVKGLLDIKRTSKPHYKKKQSGISLLTAWTGWPDADSWEPLENINPLGGIELLQDLQSNLTRKAKTKTPSALKDRKSLEAKIRLCKEALKKFEKYKEPNENSFLKCDEYSDKEFQMDEQPPYISNSEVEGPEGEFSEIFGGVAEDLGMAELNNGFLMDGKGGGEFSRVDEIGMISINDDPKE
jgi:hypothetical protein